MSHAGHRSVELKDPGYELFIGAVSLLSIVNVVLLYVVEDLSLDTVLLVMNALISVILFADFVYRLVTAPSRSEYLFRHYGWADLLSSLPLAVVKVFRQVRLDARVLERQTRVVDDVQVGPLSHGHQPSVAQAHEARGVVALHLDHLLERQAVLPVAPPVR